MKIGAKLKNLLGTVAPALGAAAGGPLGGMVGKMVSEALGVDSEAAALEAIQSNPDSLLKLKEAEHAFTTRMRELGIDEERLHQEDRASARLLAANTSIWPQIVLSALFICGYFTILGLYFSAVLVVPMDDTFQVLIGMLTTSIPIILHFWFGSSKGSSDKNAMMGSGSGKV